MDLPLHDDSRQMFFQNLFPPFPGFFPLVIFLGLRPKQIISLAAKMNEAIVDITDFSYQRNTIWAASRKLSPFAGTIERSLTTVPIKPIHSFVYTATPKLSKALHELEPRHSFKTRLRIAAKLAQQKPHSSQPNHILCP
jgi:hypothetical protein